MYLYMITNLINNKKYIGITNNYKRRWQNHKSNTDKTMAISQAIAKYGVDNFKFEVFLSNIAIEDIDAKEQEYIQKYHTHVSEGMGYNISKGGRYNTEHIKLQGTKNGRSLLTEEEVRYIKSHRDIPMYVLYEKYNDKITYQTFKDIYNHKTYLNIIPTVECYPYNLEFSSQFTSKAKLNYQQVINLRQQYAKGVYWRDAYTSEYQQIYPNEMAFWNVYNGNRYKLVMPEIFTEENKKRHTKLINHSGEANGRSKLTENDVIKMRHEFETKQKTRKQIQDEYSFVSSATINQVLRYATWKNIKKEV